MNFPRHFFSFIISTFYEWIVELITIFFLDLFIDFANRAAGWNKQRVQLTIDRPWVQEDISIGRLDTHRTHVRKLEVIHRKKSINFTFNYNTTSTPSYQQQPVQGNSIWNSKTWRKNIKWNSGTSWLIKYSGNHSSSGRRINARSQQQPRREKQLKFSVPMVFPFSDVRARNPNW